MDDIRQYFEPTLCPVDSTVKTEGNGRLGLVMPNDPYNEINLELYANWKILSVTGIDELADLQLSTTSTRSGNGVTVVDSSTDSRTIRVELLVSVDGHCDINKVKKELYELLNCSWCTERTFDDLLCGDCEEDGSGDAYIRFREPHDRRYCQLIVRCCDIVRAIDIVRSGSMSVRPYANGYLFTLEWVTPSPYMYFPQMQSKTITLEEEDFGGDPNLGDGSDGGIPSARNIPDCLCDPVNLNEINIFEKTVTIPYNGNVESYPKVSIFGGVCDFEMTFEYGGGCFSQLEESTMNLNGVTDPKRLEDGCGPACLNFREGHREFKDANGNSLYRDLGVNCTNDFKMKPNCNEEITVTITGQQVSDDFSVRLDYWVNYDGFFEADNEIPLNGECECVDVVLPEPEPEPEVPEVDPEEDGKTCVCGVILPEPETPEAVDFVCGCDK